MPWGKKYFDKEKMADLLAQRNPKTHTEESAVVFQHEKKSINTKTLSISREGITSSPLTTEHLVVQIHEAVKKNH
jgi:hypothetical protein